jgi:hypothetical protein
VRVWSSNLTPPPPQVKPFEAIAVPKPYDSDVHYAALAPMPEITPVDPIDAALDAGETRAAFLPYPASRLAAKIVPQDLTSFKTRGISRVERELQQELVELRERYLKVIDAFNWNKLIYECHMGFEPVIGEMYHLYKMPSGHQLSMIGPEQWRQKWVGSFRLNADGRWQAEDVAEDFDLRAWVGEVL